MELPILNLKGEETGKIKLPESIFALPENPGLLAQAIRIYMANQRQGNASTKTRGEVAGSTRKIYRQKGTGKARHGSNRAPIFVKGGIAFGPKPRDFSLKFSKKMKKAALNLSLSEKMKSKLIYVLTDLSDLKAKTKEMTKLLKNLKLISGKQKILLVVKDFSKNILLASRNLDKFTLTPLYQLNPYQVLNHEFLLFAKDALEELIQKGTDSEKAPELKKTIPKKEKKVLKTKKSI